MVVLKQLSCRANSCAWLKPHKEQILKVVSSVAVSVSGALLVRSKIT